MFLMRIVFYRVFFVSQVNDSNTIHHIFFRSQSVSTSVRVNVRDFFFNSIYVWLKLDAPSSKGPGDSETTFTYIQKLLRFLFWYSDIYFPYAMLLFYICNIFHPAPAPAFPILFYPGLV